MNKISNATKTAWLMAIFLGIGLTGVPSSVQASALYLGESYIDWPSLEISGIPVTWAWGKSSGAWNQVEDDFDFDYDSTSAPGWDNVFTEAISSVSHAQGYGSTDNNLLTQKLNAQVNGLDTAALAIGSTSRAGSFIADETGIFSVSVKYSLFQELNTDELGEYSFGEARAMLFMNDSKDETLTFIDSDHLYNTVVDGDKLKLAKNGLLSLDVPFEKGENGTLFIDAFGQTFVHDVVPQTSAVPEPSTMALLGMGMMGVLFKRRKLNV